MINRVQLLLNRLFSRFSQQKTKTKLISVLVLIILCCCGSLCGWAYTDAALRGAGVLPTYTPKPTDTQTPIPTHTPKPTDTPAATGTPLPTDTQVPTSTPAPTDTVIPTNTALPSSTATSLPMPTPAPALPVAGGVVITGVNKQAEYVDIRNQGSADVDLSGWVLVSEKGPQSCALNGVIGAGQSLRIWAMSADAGQGGFNCGFDSNIWNNSESDPAVLYDNSNTEVSRR